MVSKLIKSFAHDVMCCPEDGSNLRLDAGQLHCTTGGHAYRLERGVPRFCGEGYARNFGLEWNTFDRTQLDYDRGLSGATELLMKAGLSPEDVKDKLVLEAGCGAGRHSLWLADWGARVVSVDLSNAVEAAARNVKDREVQVLQADISRLPLKPEAFDIVISLGVLHHTADTRAAFDQLIPLLRPGGRISIWVYSQESNYVGSEFLRKYTTRMDPQHLLRWCRAASLARPLYRLPCLGTVLQHVLPMSIHPDREWRILDTFDWYSPAYQWKHSYPEVFEWFDAAGLVDIRPLEFPVAMTGRKA